jgi:hypothetical protein
MSDVSPSLLWEGLLANLSAREDEMELRAGCKGRWPMLSGQVQAPQAGEIVSFAVEEGQPVEYNQPLVEIAPFFGGHIIGDRKHA